MKIARRSWLATLFVVGGCLCVAIGAFLPWARSGRVDRTSFGLVAAAQRLGVLDQPAAALAKAWFAVPAAAAVVWLAAALRRDRLARVLGTVVALAGVALAVAVRQSPLAPRVGGSVTIGGAGAVAVGLLLGLVPHRNRSESES
jgi:hypothetical protein